MQERWLGVIASQPMDGLLIGGDIAESGQAIVWLERLVHQVHVPIYRPFIYIVHGILKRNVLEVAHGTIHLVAVFESKKASLRSPLLEYRVGHPRRHCETRCV